MILLDTNVVSELMRPNPDPIVRAWLVGLGLEPIATTSVTIAEITFGILRLPEGKRRDALAERFGAMILGPPSLPVLPLDEAAARHAGQFGALPEQSGLASSRSCDVGFGEPEASRCDFA
ncbi:MAG: PIN domain-containing protein, partial [Caulobacterales bacterium]